MRQPTQRGFTLIELVITLVVVAIGLLGVAAVQVRASNFQKGSFDRKAAAIATLSIAERMRANPAGYRAGQYVMTWAVGSQPNAASACSAALCTPTEVSARDVAQWQSSLAAQIGVVGAVITAPTSDDVIVSIAWLEPSASSATTSTPDDLDTSCSNPAIPGGFVPSGPYHCFSTRVYP
jgi:type IV pilus assembly protein PilV